MATTRSTLTLVTMLMVTHFCARSATSQRNCFHGTYVRTPQHSDQHVLCELCPEATFMPLTDHAYRECFNCTRVENPDLEVVVSKCNRTHDTVIQCIGGYYRQLPRNPREKGNCVKCTECQYPYYETQSCQTYSDTGCCPGVNYDVHINGDGVPLCRERPWLCRKGQYFNVDSFGCVPCPRNTFMSQDYHTMTKCITCLNSSKEHLPLHGVVTQPCTSTQQAVIGCEEGYFVNHSMGYRNKDTGCSPCTRCDTTDKPHEGRECDLFHNTVCCPEPNMQVADSPNGPRCLLALPLINIADQTTFSKTAHLTLCGMGQYLYINLSDSSASCKTCTQGTYMDEANHNKTVCKNCTKVYDASLPYSCAEHMNVQYIVNTENEETVIVHKTILWSVAALSIVLFLIFVCYTLLIHCDLLKYIDKSAKDPASTPLINHSKATPMHV